MEIIENGVMKLAETFSSGKQLSVFGGEEQDRVTGGGGVWEVKELITAEENSFSFPQLLLENTRKISVPCKVGNC